MNQINDVERSAGEQIKKAKEAAKNARTADELRRALTVILTVEHGMPLRKAADVIGRSLGWASTSRREFLTQAKTKNNNQHGGRRNQIADINDELAIMENACKEYLRASWRLLKDPDLTPQDIQIHRFVRRELEALAGHPVSKSAVYGIMRRVGERMFTSYDPVDWEWYARYLR